MSDETSSVGSALEWIGISVFILTLWFILGGNKIIFGGAC